jgi:Xaa-Pro aminopeptidase
MPHARSSLVILIFVMAASCGPRNGDDRASEGYRWPAQLQTISDRQREAELKLVRIQELLHREQISGLLLGKAENFGWITGGGDSRGKALLFLRDDGKKYLLGNEDQVRRLLAEDLNGLGYEGRTTPWYRDEAGALAAAFEPAGLIGDRAIGADLPYRGARLVDGEVTALRSPLTHQETNKYRWLGKTCAEAVRETALRIQPGMTERGIEALISASLLHRAVRPVAVLVAADVRISRFRDTPPSDENKVERVLRIGLRAERWGLTAALTRLVHFGPVPREMQQKYEAAARICAGFWARALPSVTAGTILQGAISDYAESGFPGEWKTCDQGGAIGYGGWDWIAAPGSSKRCLDGQTLAWHPGIQGLEMEDTILLAGESLEVLTEISGWPTIEVRSLGSVYRLPGILVR